MRQSGPHVIAFFKNKQLRRFLIDDRARLIVEHLINVAGDQPEMDCHGDTGRASLLALAAPHAFRSHVHGTHQVIHGWVCHRQMSGLDPCLVFESANVAKTLCANIAATVALDTVQEFLFPERQLFGFAHRPDFLCQRIWHTLHGLSDSHLGMNRERFEAPAEFGFLLCALQADQGQIVQIHLRVFEHFNDPTLLTASADYRQFCFRMRLLDQS